MLAASLLFKKIYSNAKVSSSSNELTLCLSALPSPVSRDLFLMPIQVSADSFCCGALAVHRALPGPHIAWQRTLVMRFFTLCLLKSLVHRETWRLCCAAPCCGRAWDPGVHGMGESHGCTCSDVDFSHHHWWYHWLPLEHARWHFGAL